MIAFIILHYNNLKDTIECIESIIKQKTNKTKQIIIVDNHTLNFSQEEELKKYPIHLIKLNENIGFAKANNIGCEYAIKNFEPDFIVVSNNDIVIEDEQFINKIYEIDKKEKFDMLGPSIRTEGGQSVNPFPVYKTKEEVEYQIEKTKKLIKIYNNIVLRNLLKWYITIKSFLKGKRLVYNGTTKEYNVALHGCFIIFSKKYYKKYDSIFYNETFLYHEEEFLYQRVLYDKLVSIYDPSIEVLHKEGASLNHKFKKQKYAKLIFKNEQILKSLELLKQQMKKYESRD